MRNLEIKAKVRDLKPLRNIAAKVGATLGGKDRQEDTYFKVAEGRLKLRESSLSGGELIAYFRADGIDPAESKYEKVRVQDPLRLKKILKKTLGVAATVVKEREVYRLGNVRIHLDAVEGLGEFIEFEVELKEGGDNGNSETTMADLISVFNIERVNLVEKSYGDMIGR